MRRSDAHYDHSVLMSEVQYKIQVGDDVRTEEDSVSVVGATGADGSNPAIRNRRSRPSISNGIRPRTYPPPTNRRG